jgi:hypothetical protein
LAEDPRLEAGARARCAFYGLNPDEPALESVAKLRYHLDSFSQSGAQ